MLNKINLYILLQIVKSCSLIFFIFISIAWLLQLTRLLSLTNLIQIDILNVFILSLYLVPNLITVIMPFILIFGVLLCFIKLNKDKEIIALFSLGMNMTPIKYSLIIFSSIILFIHISLNFYISPKVYDAYKLKEFELRNTIDFNKIVTSNFLKLNKNTTLDFKKKGGYFEDIFISSIREKEKIIYAKKGIIENEENKFVFQLNKGFRINIGENNEIEKIEFENYTVEVDNENSTEFDRHDKNSLTIFDDINNYDILNISFKIFDILFLILIIFIFYYNNIFNYNLGFGNNLIFIIYSVFILIINQFLKNTNVNPEMYIFTTLSIIIISLIFLILKRKYEQN